MDPEERHRQIREMYQWSNVAKRTEIVYGEAMVEPEISWSQRLYRYYEAGIGFGCLYIIVAVINFVLITVLDYFDPPHGIPEANDRPIDATSKKPSS